MKNAWKYAIAIAMTLINLTAISFMFTAKSYVRDTVRDELTGYVTEKEYELWRTAHKQWEEEIFRGLDAKMSELKITAQEAKALSQENNILIRELRVELKFRGRAGLEVPGKIGPVL